MADIFISYAREDRNWVRGLAQALEAEGLSVWWDPNLLPGSRYREIIEKQLEQAYASIVVWSEDSIKSDFVRDEAEEARVLNRLVPVLKDAVQPPHGFRQIQTADLSSWQGKRDHPEYMLVLEGLQALAATKNGGVIRPIPEPKRPAPRNLVDKLKSPAGMGIAAVAIALAIVLAFLAGRSGHDGQTAPAGKIQQQTSVASANPSAQQAPSNPSQMTLAQKVDACIAGGRTADVTVPICSDALQAPNLSPQNIVRMRVDRGSAYNLQGQYQKALDDFNIALDIDPNYETAIAMRGHAHYLLQQGDAALADYNLALHLNPSDSETYGMRGDLEFNNWQFAPAIADYQRATQLAPGDFLGWESLCKARAAANVDLGVAESDCNHALELDNTGADTYETLGFVRLRQTNNQGAIDAYNRSLTIQPNVSSALFGRALAEQKLGNTADANRDFAAARALDSTIDAAFSRLGMTP